MIATTTSPGRLDGVEPHSTRSTASGEAGQSARIAACGRAADSGPLVDRDRYRGVVEDPIIDEKAYAPSIESSATAEQQPRAAATSRMRRALARKTFRAARRTADAIEERSPATRLRSRSVKRLCDDGEKTHFRVDSPAMQRLCYTSSRGRDAVAFR